METPFRNDRMLDDILKVCHPSTRLCIAADITMSTESIITRSVAEWLRERPDIDKKPVVFLLLA